MFNRLIILLSYHQFSPFCLTLFTHMELNFRKGNNFFVVIESYSESGQVRAK